MSMRSFARGVLAVTGIVLATTAALMVAQTILAERSFRQMGEEISTVEDTDSGWNRLLQVNDETIGWLAVDGTAIDYPVVQPGNSIPDDFYLTHDFWRRADSGGCPYLDVRTQIDGRHLLVFGHRFEGTGRMFSSLSRAWDEDVFPSIGTALLSAPNRVTASFLPLCALRVDQDFPDIQRFDFEDDAAVRSWLEDIVEQADVRREDAAIRIGRAHRALTLVTCAGARSGGRERTLVVFTADTAGNSVRTG